MKALEPSMENFSKYNWIEKVHESGVNSRAKNIGFGFFRFTFQDGLSVKVTKNQLCQACGYEEDSEAGRKFAQRGIKALEDAGYLVRVAEGASAGRSRLVMDEPAVWRLALPGTVAVDSAFKGDGLTDKSVRKRAEGESLTDKSVRNGLVGKSLTDKSVHLTDKSVPPNTLELYKDHHLGDEDDSFTELLATHPKPEKSSQARHHWRAVIEEGHTPADIIAWARGYAEWAKTREPRYVKALSGWLEARHWVNQPGGVSYRKAVGEDEERALVAAAVLKRAQTMGNPSELERLTGLPIGNEDALKVMLRDERDLLTALIVDGLRAGKQPNSY